MSNADFDLGREFAKLGKSRQRVEEADFLLNESFFQGLFISLTDEHDFYKGIEYQLGIKRFNEHGTRDGEAHSQMYEEGYQAAFIAAQNICKDCD